MVPMAPSATRTRLASRSRNSEARVIGSVAMGNARKGRREARKLRYRLILAQSGNSAAWRPSLAYPERRRLAMTITVDIGPDIEAELARQAAEHGLGLGAYAASLLEQAAALLPASLVKRNAPAEAKDKDMVELFAPLRGLNLDFERDRDTGRDIDLRGDIWLTRTSRLNSLAKYQMRAWQLFSRTPRKRA